MFFIFVKNTIMVTILKVKNESNSDVSFKINQEFIDAHEFSVFDRMLVKESECGNYEYLYLFLNQAELNTFINIALKEDTTIFYKNDFTDDLINIIINNKLDEFKSEFDLGFDFYELFTFFYLESITKDMILDKICFNGKDSLTKYDYEILEQ